MSKQNLLQHHIATSDATTSNVVSDNITDVPSTSQNNTSITPNASSNLTQSQPSTSLSVYNQVMNEKASQKSNQLDNNQSNNHQQNQHNDENSRDIDQHLTQQSSSINHLDASTVQPTTSSTVQHKSPKVENTSTSIGVDHSSISNPADASVLAQQQQQHLDGNKSRTIEPNTVTEDRKPMMIANPVTSIPELSSTQRTNNLVQVSNNIQPSNVSGVHATQASTSAVAAIVSPIQKKNNNTAPFVCDVVGCGKRFGKKFNLKAHKRVHTGHEPFQCSYPTCGKRFKWKSSLTFHEGLHLNASDDVQATNADLAAAATNVVVNSASSKKPNKV